MKQIFTQQMIRRAAATLVLTAALLPLQAQPSWVKKATKSVFTVKTFAADGSLIASSNGFFVGNNGEAVSNFTPFKSAARAIIIDAQGKETEVVSILGANDIYDVVKFKVASTKTQSLPISRSAATVGSMAWLLPYREVKAVPSGEIRKAETFQNDYTYYTLRLKAPEHAESCPLINADGEAIGLLQPSANAADTLSYAISAVFADSLRITGFTINDPVLLSTQIKKELPDNIQEANLAIFLAGSRNDTLAYASLVDDMIGKFPDLPDGYTYRAQLAANKGDYAAADRDINMAVAKATKKDEAHFSYARLIYNKVLFDPGTTFEPWTLDKALAEVQTAVGSNPLPTYRQLEANTLFAMQKYQEAYDVYMELTSTNLRNAEIFFSAAKCKAQQRDTTAMLALMDSTVSMFSKPYLKEAAPYVWERAMARRHAGKYRDAVNDMNDYEQLMAASVNDNFYYIRHQTEIQARLYQQALNDIDRAIQINPQETLYYAEKASLQVRVGLYGEAETTAQECIAVDPNNSDGYLFLGLAQCLKGNKQQGLENLRKAKDLGDSQAEALIEKYQ